MLRVETSSPEKTAELGRRLGEAVTCPISLLLTGSYGTGKTTFAQGLARGLGVTGLVRSPSYSIVRTYVGTNYGFVHADLYRMNSLADIDELGLTDILGENSVIAVEWPGTVEGFSLGLPAITLEFGFSTPTPETNPDSQDDCRVIELSFSADCPANLLEVASAFVA